MLNRFIFVRYKKEILAAIEKNYKYLILQELIFTVGYILWVFVRAHQPDINGLEKLMDFGFINSTLRGKFLPPADMWLAGSSINYYWYGHYITALITKLSQVPSTVTFNLMLATILGSTLTGVFSLVATLISKTTKLIDNKKIIFAGIIAAVAVAFAGNFHSAFYILKDGESKYWYPDATRFIGYNPETNDKTIHEFPIYSFVVSDLHAHLIGLPFVFIFLGLIWRAFAAEENKEKKNTLKRLKDHLIKFVPIGFMLGVMFMTNAWDFANYALISGFIILFMNLKKYKFNFETIFRTALPMITIVSFGLITTLLFLLKFESIAEGVAMVNAHTPIWQLAILWGFPAVFTLILLLKLLLNRKLVNQADLFVLALLASAWALIFLPEVIFVKDIYIASHHRANTMFKLTYQAYVISYLSSGYITIRVMTLSKSFLQRMIFATFLGLIYFSVLYYPKIATYAYYGELKTYRGLAGDTWLKERYPDTYQIVSWFKENVKSQPVILEAAGDSYTDYNIISAYTGLPTISGWFVHEWLWRGSSEVPQAKVAEITEIYTTPDADKAKIVLDKYKVKYVVIGSFERERYPELIEHKFEQIGKTVFSTGNTKIYQIN